MLKGLRKLKNRLAALDSTTIKIVAAGNYPDKRKTRVADVAMYQNDGTAKITASHFVERAADAAGEWNDAIASMVVRYLEGNRGALKSLGKTVAREISKMCDRIKTRQLKKSFIAHIKNGS